ncbi:MAG TPA: imidazole glycerol phosphate synthase subunit HisH [Mycobacteriales bacterium]|nr:imidazole glycerol phosphate synthase subunit HisH [Mycobacteriales bacterium]
MPGKRSVVVIDHGSGNLRSAERALARIGAEVEVTADLAAARAADGVVLPGVGAFAACMTGVRGVSADTLVRERVAAGRPVLGICVGMQVLYGAGEEHGLRTEGVAVLPGEVVRLDAAILPHMGWNTVTPATGSSLFTGVGGERFYFVHSYGVRPGGSAGETLTTHGEPFVAAVETASLSATQFHPEKSGDAGLTLLENWLNTL